MLRRHSNKGEAASLKILVGDATPASSSQTSKTSRASVAKGTGLSTREVAAIEAGDWLYSVTVGCGRKEVRDNLPTLDQDELIKIKDLTEDELWVIGEAWVRRYMTDIVEQYYLTKEEELSNHSIDGSPSGTIPNLTENDKTYRLIKLLGYDENMRYVHKGPVMFRGTMLCAVVVLGITKFIHDQLREKFLFHAYKTSSTPDDSKEESDSELDSDDDPGGGSQTQIREPPLWLRSAQVSINQLAKQSLDLASLAAAQFAICYEKEIEVLPAENGVAPVGKSQLQVANWCIDSTRIREVKTAAILLIKKAGRASQIADYTVVQMQSEAEVQEAVSKEEKEEQRKLKAEKKNADATRREASKVKQVDDYDQEHVGGVKDEVSALWYWYYSAVRVVRKTLVDDLLGQRYGYYTILSNLNEDYFEAYQDPEERKKMLKPQKQHTLEEPKVRGKLEEQQRTTLSKTRRGGRSDEKKEKKLGLKCNNIPMDKMLEAVEEVVPDNASVVSVCHAITHSLPMTAERKRLFRKYVSMCTQYKHRFEVELWRLEAKGDAEGMLEKIKKEVIRHKLGSHKDPHPLYEQADNAQITGWTRDLVADGDVEANPGPSFKAMFKDALTVSPPVFAMQTGRMSYVWTFFMERDPNGYICFTLAATNEFASTEEATGYLFLGIARYIRERSQDLSPNISMLVRARVKTIKDAQAVATRVARAANVINMGKMPNIDSVREVEICKGRWARALAPTDLDKIEGEINSVNSAGAFLGTRMEQLELFEHNVALYLGEKEPQQQAPPPQSAQQFKSTDIDFENNNFLSPLLRPQVQSALPQASNRDANMASIVSSVTAHTDLDRRTTRLEKLVQELEDKVHELEDDKKMLSATVSDRIKELKDMDERMTGAMIEMADRFDILRTRLSAMEVQNNKLEAQLSKTSNNLAQVIKIALQIGNIELNPGPFKNLLDAIGMLLPRYGKYGGQGYSSGVEGGEVDPDVAAVDKLDNLFKEHDIAYKSDDPAIRLAADKHLIEMAETYPPESFKAYMYAKVAKHLFKTKAVLLEQMGPKPEDKPVSAQLPSPSTLVVLADSGTEPSSSKAPDPLSSEPETEQIEEIIAEMTQPVEAPLSPIEPITVGVTTTPVPTFDNTASGPTQAAASGRPSFRRRRLRLHDILAVVFLPLLLIMAGDVELNPGPFIQPTNEEAVNKAPTFEQLVGHDASGSNVFTPKNMLAGMIADWQGTGDYHGSTDVEVYYTDGEGAGTLVKIIPEVGFLLTQRIDAAGAVQNLGGVTLSLVTDFVCDVRDEEHIPDYNKVGESLIVRMKEGVASKPYTSKDGYGYTYDNDYKFLIINDPMDNADFSAMLLKSWLYIDMFVPRKFGPCYGNTYNYDGRWNITPGAPNGGTVNDTTINAIDFGGTLNPLPFAYTDDTSPTDRIAFFDHIMSVPTNEDYWVFPMDQAANPAVFVLLLSEYPFVVPTTQRAMRTGVTASGNAYSIPVTGQVRMRKFYSGNRLNIVLGSTVQPQTGPTLFGTLGADALLVVNTAAAVVVQDYDLSDYIMTWYINHVSSIGLTDLTMFHSDVLLGKLGQGPNDQWAYQMMCNVARVTTGPEGTTAATSWTRASRDYTVANHVAQFDGMWLRRVQKTGNTATGPLMTTRNYHIPTVDSHIWNCLYLGIVDNPAAPSLVQWSLQYHHIMVTMFNRGLSATSQVMSEFLQLTGSQRDRVATPGNTAVAGALTDWYKLLRYYEATQSWAAADMFATLYKRLTMFDLARNMTGQSIADCRQATDEGLGHYGNYLPISRPMVFYASALNNCPRALLNPFKMETYPENTDKNIPILADGTMRLPLPECMVVDSESPPPDDYLRTAFFFISDTNIMGLGANVSWTTALGNAVNQSNFCYSSVANADDKYPASTVGIPLMNQPIIDRTINQLRYPIIPAAQVGYFTKVFRGGFPTLRNVQQNYQEMGRNQWAPFNPKNSKNVISRFLSKSQAPGMAPAIDGGQVGETKGS